MSDDRIAMVAGPDNYCVCENKIPRRCSHCGRCWWCGKPIDPADNPPMRLWKSSGLEQP